MSAYSASSAAKPAKPPYSLIELALRRLAPIGKITGLAGVSLRTFHDNRDTFLDFATTGGISPARILALILALVLALALGRLVLSLVLPLFPKVSYHLLRLLAPMARNGTLVRVGIGERQRFPTFVYQFGSAFLHAKYQAHQLRR